MQEADVARQLMSDLQANAGIITIFIILLLLLAIVRLASTLGNATRALRRVNDVVTGETVASFEAAAQAGPRYATLQASTAKALSPAPAALARYRTAMRAGDILAPRAPIARRSQADTDRQLSPRPLQRRKIV